jgi:hypothetical protein
MHKLLVILRGVGPHPLRLARIVLFLTERQRRRYALALARRKGRRRRFETQLLLPPVALVNAATLPQPLRSAADRIRLEADALLEHRFDILGSGPTSLGTEIDWQRDFKSGQRWEPVGYRRLQAVRLDDRSDPMVPWELSQGHQLLTLARAALLFEDERYADELERQIESWLSANPPGIGINWTSSLETAVRAVNWIWALATIEPYRPVSGALRERIAESLYEHGRQLDANVEGVPGLRDNHFVGTALGLLAVGGALPRARRAKRWASYGARSLERELAGGTLTDGVWPESSLSYHGFVLEIFLLGRHLATQTGRPFRGSSDQRLCQMLEVSRALRHPNGRIPLFGDQSDTRVLPASFDRTPTHDNLLWLGAGVLGLARPLAGCPDPELAWTLGLESWLEVRDRPLCEPSPARRFASGGLYVLSSQSFHIAVHCGPECRRGVSRHAHNDTLSFELSLDGTPVIVDSGTYVYTADIDARARFRAAAAHNVVMLDGEEPRPIAPRRVFELPKGIGCRVESWREDAAATKLIAVNRDYERLPSPAQIRRTFTLERTNRPILTVEDELLGGACHEIASRLHLALGAEVRLSGQIAEIELKSVSIRISFSGFERLLLLEGEVSERYGVRRRAPVLAASVMTQLPTRVGYRIESTASEQ